MSSILQLLVSQMSRIRKSKIEPYRTTISAWLQSGLSQKEIVRSLRTEHNIQLSERRLRFHLQKWDLRTYSSARDLEEFQPQITDWYLTSNYSAHVILDILNEQQVKTSLRTLLRKFQEWGLKKENHLSYDNIPLIKNQVYHFFINLQYSDEIILKELNDQGYELSMNQLINVRKRLGLKRWKSEAEWETEKDTARATVQEELEKGLIDSYGRTYLITFFRRKGLVIGRYHPT
jgi:hypothetical protein